MRIVVNGLERSVSALTLADLVTAEDLDPRFVATAVNGDFVPRDARSRTPLAEGDAVEILTPRQGG
jgi:thiamine biosynthesis protein ThiS